MSTYRMTVSSTDTMIGLSASSMVPAKVKRAEAEEQTPPQSAESDRLASLFGSSSGARIGFQPPPPGTYKTYDDMGRYPTITIVMAAALMPVITNEISIETTDESVPEEWRDFIEDNVEAAWPDIIRDGVGAVAKGWAPFEVCYQTDGRRITLDEDNPLKSLDPAFTKLVQDEKTGQILGIENQVPGYDPVQLLGPKAWWHTNGRKYGDPFGLPRHENVRNEWSEVVQIQHRLAHYLKKVAATIVQIHYPAEGESYMEGGAKYPNSKVAADLLMRAARNESVMFPNLFAAEIERDPSKAADLAGKSSWILSALDIGGSDMSKGFIDALSYYDKLLVRGWMHPERQMIEGQHGTRADAATHADLGVLDCENISREFARSFNRGITDRLLTMNFGPKARGAVRIVPAPIGNDTTKSWDAVIQSALGAPQIGPALASVVDWISMLEDQGIPVRQKLLESAKDNGIPIVLTSPTPATGTPKPVKPTGNPGGASDSQNMSRPRVKLLPRDER